MSAFFMQSAEMSQGRRSHKRDLLLLLPAHRCFRDNSSLFVWIVGLRSFRGVYVVPDDSGVPIPMQAEDFANS
jgi:hypothetical protein